MNNRIGRFVISRLFVEKDPETARAVMGMVIVVRCEMMLASDTLEYMALSPEFDEVQEGEIIPTYEVHINEGVQRIEFVRKK